MLRKAGTYGSEFIKSDDRVGADLSIGTMGVAGEVDIATDIGEIGSVRLRQSSCQDRLASKHATGANTTMRRSRGRVLASDVPAARMRPLPTVKRASREKLAESFSFGEPKMRHFEWRSDTPELRKQRPQFRYKGGMAAALRLLDAEGYEARTEAA
jgi:hypothetical protein